MSISRGMPRIASSPQKLGEWLREAERTALTGNQPGRHFNLRLLASITEQTSLCCFSRPPSLDTLFQPPWQKSSGATERAEMGAGVGGGHLDLVGIAALMPAWDGRKYTPQAGERVKPSEMQAHFKMTISCLENMSTNVFVKQSSINLGFGDTQKIVILTSGCG